MDLDKQTVGDDVLFGETEAATVPPPLLVSAPVMDLAMHPYLPLFVAGLVTGEVEVHEFCTSETRRRLITHQFFADVDTSQPTNPYNVRMHPRGSVTAMEFTEDGNYLVTASSDRTISVMDCVAERIVMHIAATDGKESRLSSGIPAGGVDGKHNKKKGKGAAGGVDLKGKAGKCRSFPAKKGAQNPHKFGISALNVCDENTVATGDDDGMIVLWDMRQSAPAHRYHEHGDFVSQMLYFSDIEELVSSSGDTCLGVFDMRAGRIRDYSEKRKDELSCFAFVNNTGINTDTFIPSIVCGTPSGGLPVWKFGSWRRPYDLLDRHPPECESIISFNNPDSTFNHNLILTGACDGLVRVIEMYPVRRNLCQLSARDYTYAHQNSVGGKSSGNYSNAAVRRERGSEGISRMRLSHDSALLAVCGSDSIIDFVDVRFLSNEKELNKMRSQAEQRHLTILKEIEAEKEAQGRNDSDEDVDSGSEEDYPDEKRLRLESAKSGEGASDSDSDADKSGSEVGKNKTERQKKRERVAAAKWLKAEKRKKVNFTFEKRKRRVNGFFSDLT
ncbi:WD domain [Trypanosoma vivax]|uniref:Uncharacterized protein n=1 Tax=Trypanosoma vivax (strain Y486) TaxID=1055687 RepID=G0U7U3_TRYVY|nr:hypothetical protein TRVL_00418 [Trypanosoma vivax]KAH8620599.1 WD domain [Trypanosoma vivax]CCC51951.1 conserved hypothetical protein [Trypanosoma vivax Y486]